jgi:hypothetical protein
MARTSFTEVEALGARRNGTQAVALKLQALEFDLGEIGYPEWLVTIRTNPRSSVHDSLLDTEDMPRWWAAFGQIVRAWNFADEDGQPFPLPREVESERDLDLPVAVVGYIYRRYIESFREAIGLPKVPDSSSATTSATSDDRLTGG